jgi:hypothetical protein
VLGILLNAATVLSLLLCVATVVLWVRSYWGVGSAAARVGPLCYGVHSADGRVSIVYCRSRDLGGSDGRVVR